MQISGQQVLESFELLPIAERMKVAAEIIFRTRDLDLPMLTDDAKVWLDFSAQGLDTAYSDDEPEYPLTLIKEENPEYERG